MSDPAPSNDPRAPAEAKVSFIELFFDLVFVFAVTQLSHHLVEHLTLSGALETGLLLLAVWTVWSYTTWATNWLGTHRTPVRLMMFGLMAAGLVVSTAIPEAFGKTGLAFAVSYTLMQNGRSLFGLCSLEVDTRQLRLNLYRIQFWLLVAGVLWIAGGFSHGVTRILLWSAAVAVELGSPWCGFWTPGIGPSTTTDWNVSGHHFAERCGLFVIIALGESILVTGATFSRLETTWPAVAAFACGIRRERGDVVGVLLHDGRRSQPCAGQGPRSWPARTRRVHLFTPSAGRRDHRQRGRPTSWCSHIQAAPRAWPPLRRSSAARRCSLSAARSSIA